MFSKDSYRAYEKHELFGFEPNLGCQSLANPWFRFDLDFDKKKKIRSVTKIKLTSSFIVKSISVELLKPWIDIEAHNSIEP